MSWSVIYFLASCQPKDFVKQIAYLKGMKAMLLILLYTLQFSTAQSQQPHTNLRISHLTGEFYIFTTYNYYQGNRIPANGMYVVTGSGAILLDSPWDTTQFQPLLDSIEVRHKCKVVICIASHFHEDRTGGLEYYSRQGIKTYTTRLTDKLSRERGMKRAEFLIANDTVFTIGKYSFQTYYPGHGHSPDNIVFWFEKEKILYGGCLIKSAADETLGNLGDADVNVYAQTLKNVQKKYPSARFIIPGHGSWNDTRSVQHTIYMAERKLEELKKQ